MERRLVDRKSTDLPRKPWGSGMVSPFVGREDEMRRLSTALSRAVEGQGGTVFLTGQPGIGKTRLAKEVMEVAKGRGFTVLEGRAYPLGAGLAYAPIIDAFGPLLRDLSPVLLETLVTGLPDLGRLLTGLQLPPPEPLGDPSLEKTRLFETVLRLLDRLTDAMPVVLFVDDVHRADPASLELLHYLSRGLAGRRALLLATCSAEIADVSPGLREMMRSLWRDGLAEEIVVPRLLSEPAGKLVRAILGGEVPDKLLILLDTRAAGTPLFVEALVAALIDSSDLVRVGTSWKLADDRTIELPSSVRYLIAGRLERLELAERHVLELIAVMGNAVSHPDLLAAIHADEESVLNALRRLQAAGLVAEGIDGSDVTYRITHPLIQEVAYAELPEMVRRRAHLAAIEAIERLRPDDLNRLARHYRGAGPDANSARALTVLLAAGERARSVYANEEAARHYQTALKMLRKDRGLRVEGEGGLSILNTQPSTLPWLLERLGEVWELAGEREAAVGAWSEALAERERVVDVVAASRLRCRLAQAEWERGHFDIAKAHLREGLVLLTEGRTDREPCQELVDLQFVRHRILYRLGDIAGVGEAAFELSSLTKRLPSARAEAETSLAISGYCLWQNDVTNARARALHALEVAEKAQELAICCQAHHELASVGIYLGDHRFVLDHAERGMTVAKHLGAPDLAVVFGIYLARGNLIAGNWQESLRHSSEAISLARRVGCLRELARASAVRAMTLAYQGDLAEAETYISEARVVLPWKDSPAGEGSADRSVFGLIDMARVAIALERGQAKMALEIARGFISPSESAVTPACLTAPNLPMGLMLLAEAQVAAGELASALKTARKIAVLCQNPIPYLNALASRAEGIALEAMGRPEAAMNCLALAYDIFTELEMTFEAARSLLEQGISALPGRAGDPEFAMRAAKQSLAAFELLGSRRYAGHARRVLRDLGVSPPPTRSTSARTANLSARELEVARLVAEGLTTIEIAKRLGLSWRTVDHHIERIYDRLDISSRSALTRYVIEAGLLSTDRSLI